MNAMPALDANGNIAGTLISHKTGARARVGSAYAPRFQAYIDDLENNYGATVHRLAGLGRRDTVFLRGAPSMITSSRRREPELRKSRTRA